MDSSEVDDKMKKTFFIVATIIVSIAVGRFYWKNLRGVAPAIKKPSQDITKLIDPGKNHTDFSLNLPPGFSISIYAEKLKNPRDITQAGYTTLVSIPSEGEVIALPDRNNDYKADAIISVISNLKSPHGLEIDS